MNDLDLTLSRAALAKLEHMARMYGLLRAAFVKLKSMCPDDEEFADLHDVIDFALDESQLAAYLDRHKAEIDDLVDGAPHE